MTKKTISIKIVELNNKSRQGTYLYLRAGDRKPAYYRYNPAYKVDYYIKYYLDLPKRQNKRQGPSITRTLKTYKSVETGKPLVEKVKKGDKVRSDAERYMRKLKKQYGGRTLEKMLKRGIQAVIINDANKAGPGTIKTAYKKLLQDIVLDQRLLDILATEENMKKMANRLEQRIEIKDEQGKTLISANKIGTTTTEAVAEMQQTFKKGEEIDERKEGYLTGSVGIKIRRLENLAYQNIKSNDTGKIGRIQITTILRKGK